MKEHPTLEDELVPLVAWGRFHHCPQDRHLQGLLEVGPAVIYPLNEEDLCVRLRIGGLPLVLVPFVQLVHAPGE